MTPAKLLSIISFALAFAATTLQADTLSIIDNPNQAKLSLPQRGLSMAAVEEQFGPPASIVEAIGQPPITRWIYPDFTVYFEDIYVIHPVARTSHTGLSVE